MAFDGLAMPHTRTFETCSSANSDTPASDGLKQVTRDDDRAQQCAATEYATDPATGRPGRTAAATTARRDQAREIIEIVSKRLRRMRLPVGLPESLLLVGYQRPECEAVRS